MDLFNRAVSERLKERGMAITASYPNDAWVTQARAVAEMLAAKHGSVTINDVLKVFPRPESINPNSTGSVMRSKHLKLTGYTKSDKVSAHARMIGIYEFKD